MNPVLEGNETFTVFLSSAIGSSLVQPFIASVVIQDDQLDGKFLSLLHSEQPKLYGVLAVLSAVGLKILAVFTIFLGYKMDLDFQHCFGREKLNLKLNYTD